jgi:hypothetical protein
MLPLHRTLAALIALLAPSLLGCDAEPPEGEAADLDGAMLEVDARAPSDAAQTRLVLFVGDIGEPPASLGAIEKDAEFAPMIHRRIVLGGRDANRLASFREVEADTYTVCVASGRMSGSWEAQEAKIEAAYASVGGGDLSAPKLEAAVAVLRADPTFVDPKIDWSAVPVRCRVIEVTADAASRRVTIE